jgi:hypothetical protein
MSNNNNNNTDDIDEYEYVTYADKYFGDQPDNETIYTEPIIIPNLIEQLETEIYVREEKINKLKYMINIEYDNINYTNRIKNNSNNNTIDFTNQIKNIEKSIHNLTNELEDLEYKQNSSQRIYHKPLIEDAEKYAIQLKKSRSEYEKIVLNEPEKKEIYVKKKRC